MLYKEYARIVTDTIAKISEEEETGIKKAAELIAASMKKGGLIYAFGCGHSHIVTEEIFYRAGGLANVYPVFCEPLMLHESASLSSELEKQDYLQEKVLDGYDITEKDVFICISSSGKNAVPVQVAEEARKRAGAVIVITSSAYYNDEIHNASGKLLKDVCDVCLDNKVPHGDACLQLQGLEVKMTPVSTIASAFLINSILAEAAQLVLNDGQQVPVFMSGNIDGGKEYNKKLIEEYKKRISCL